MGKKTNPTGSSFDLIITTYNRRELVSRAVNSALDQDCPELTVTVVDDGGSDGTTGLLRETFGDRISVLEKPNGGLSSARNYGITKTRGAFIAFLDDDDVLLPGKLRRQRDLFLGDPEMGFCCSAGYMEKSWREGRELVREEHRGQVLGALLRQNFGPPHGYAVRRSLVEEVGGFDEELTSVEDWDYWLRCAARTNCGYDPAPGYIYHLEEGNMSRDHENMLHHYLLVYDRHVDAWDGSIADKRDYRAGHLVKFVRRFMDSGDVDRAAIVFRDALRESPLAVRLLPRPYLRQYLAADGEWFSRHAPALVNGSARGTASGAGNVLRAGARQASVGDLSGARRLMVVAMRGLASGKS